MSGQHDVLDSVFHGVHLLGGGRQEGQGPDALLCTPVAQVATFVLLSVALQGGIRRGGGGQSENEDFPPRSAELPSALPRDYASDSAIF